MAEQDPNTMVHTHVDENGNVITHCHGWPARSAIWSRSSAW